MVFVRRGDTEWIRVHLDLLAVRGIYDGNLSAAKNSMFGTWRKVGDPTPLISSAPIKSLSCAAAIPLNPIPTGGNLTFQIPRRTFACRDVNTTARARAFRRRNSARRFRPAGPR